jgi:hypothetical protein
LHGQLVEDNQKLSKEAYTRNESYEKIFVFADSL